jgi:hypothetical protein
VPSRLPERLSESQLADLRALLARADLPLCAEPSSVAKLTSLRAMYEPFIEALARHFLLTLPPFLPDKPTVDNWQSSPWTKRTPGIGQLHLADGDEHFS